jgi:hypothetical protein
MTRRRVAPLLCFAGAVLFLAAAALRTYEVLEPTIRWKAVDAKTNATSMRYRHDGDGRLVFYVHTRLVYGVAGEQITAEAGSDYSTYKFSEVRKAAQKVASASAIRAYWNPSDPKRVRFLLDYARLLRPDISLPALAAVLLGITGLRLRNWKPDSKCVRCAMPIKAFYRFCPHCKTPLHTTRSSVAIQAPSETTA